MARTTYKRNAKFAGRMSKDKAKYSAKLEKMASKYGKDSEKYNRLMAISKDAAERSKELANLSDIAKQKVRDIDEGKLKAGRDFIVRMEVNVNPIKAQGFAAIMDDRYKPKLGEMSRMTSIGYNNYKVIETKNDAAVEKHLNSLKKQRENLQKDIEKLYAKGQKYDQHTPWDEWDEAASDKNWYDYDDKNAELLAVNKKIKEIENGKD